MNEFTAKKLGEVYAFIKVGEGQFRRGRSALSSVMPEVEIERIGQTYDEHLAQMEEIVRGAPLAEIITAKAEKTSEKLLAMADVYMKSEDDWANPAEILEWSGFFEGGAIVHLALAESATRESGLIDMATFTAGAADFHRHLLSDIEIAITALAEKKASE